MQFIHSKDGYLARPTNSVHHRGEAKCPRFIFTRQLPSRPSSTSPGSPTSGRAARSSSATAPTSTSRCIDQGPAQADVTEGSGGVWERLHYDWSDPSHVVLTTTDSNVWGGASGHTYTFTRQPDGTTEIDVVVVREGKNLKGRLLGFVVGTIGKTVLEKAFVNTVKAIEARNGAAKRGVVCGKCAHRARAARNDLGPLRSSGGEGNRNLQFTKKGSVVHEDGPASGGP